MPKKEQAPRSPPTPRSPPATPDAEPVIVGIGGSAGALSPLRELFAALPPDSGMAFVVVTHQAPSGRSLLPEILSKSTGMPVREIGAMTKAEPNHVYVAARGCDVAVRAGVLGTELVAERGRPPLPIDSFFRALARDRAQRAVGIVLSGTGSDGTLGLAAIRAECGLSLAQAPETAEFEGMPTSAIAAGATDFVLPVHEMPARLIAYARTVSAPEHGGELAGVSSSEMEQILALIRVRGGHDFSAYKRQTLLRRVERRMVLHRIEDLADYARYLEENDEEIEALWRDWLIGVTAFFRDPEAFQALSRSGLPELIAPREDGSTLRVWVPGCATGEEAYSIAIVLLEAIEHLGKHLDIQVFATDLDPAAIRVARTGRYPEGISADVGAERLKRFFLKEDRHYRAKKTLRDLIVFAVQNLLHDPPFTRLDLISCRNLLIYMIPSAQQRLLPMFHYSLNPGGLLLLGAGESVTGSEELFSSLDQRWKLFRRNDAARPALPIRWAHRPTVPVTAGRAARAAALDVAEPVRRHLAERYGPPAVVVDAAGAIQQIHGRVDPFLALVSGRPHLNVLEMARDGLRAPLAAALREIKKSRARVVERTARVKAGRHWLSLRLVVARIDDRRLANPLLLVSFEPPGSASQQAAAPGGRTARGRRASPRDQLEEELQLTRHDLQTSIDELQTANEELSSANEEVQSVNEELQSSNEELQTSKEEAQALNEELHSVNGELTDKLQAFERAKDDLLNLIQSIEIATIFLDEQLRVKRFTPQARSVVPLIDADLGRPLADLALLLDYPDLLSDADSVLRRLEPSEKEVSGPNGSWYDVRIRPYRTDGNAVEGLVLTFVDITETKRAERTRAAGLLAESIVDAIREPLLILDGALRVIRGNRAFYRLFRVERKDTDGQIVGDLGSRQWNVPRLRELLEKTARECVGFDDLEIEHEFPSIGRRRIRLNARPVPVEDGGPVALIILGFEDLTGREPASPRAPKETHS